MQARRWTCVLVVGGLAVAPISASATVDIAQLRTNCGGVTSCTTAPPTAITCCETSMATLTTWLWGTRKPTSGAPVLVDVGPGTFGNFNCPSATPVNGYTTLRGSGRDRTTISGMSVTSCHKLSIQDLNVSAAGFAITWSGGGSSQWSNVAVDATSAGGFAVGFLDLSPSPSTPKTLHYWFGSKVRSSGGAALNAPFYVQSSETWFYGGEIEADLSPTGTSGFSTSTAINLIGVGDIRLFGVAVRSRSGGACSAGTVHGVRVQGSGMLHMHGGIINVDGRSTAASCTAAIGSVALEGQNSGHAHTPGTAFQVSANGSGILTRLSRSGSAHLESPYLWPPGTTPPSINSLDGADLFVETDCAGAACVAGGGSDTHMMIFNPSACPTPTWTRWFDATTGSCRQ